MPEPTQVRNAALWARFDARTGAWLGLGYAGSDESVVRTVGSPFELVVDGEPFFGARRHVSRQRSFSRGRGAVLVFERDGLQVTHTVEVDPVRPVLRQQISVCCLEGRDARLLTDVVFRFPGFAPGDPADCLYQAPGQLIPIDTPYRDVVARCARQGCLDLQPAPCHTAGLVALENVRLGRVASTWLISDEAVAFPRVSGDGELLMVEHRHHIAAWLRPGTEVVSRGHGALLTEGSLDEHLAEFRDAAYELYAAGGPRLASATDVPAWFRDARVFQIAPYPLSDWSPRLSEIRDMGFNVVYLCPVQSTPDRGWYDILDHFAVSSRVGTEEELKRFVARAHDLGLRVILDYLPQGVSVESPFVDAHPEWLVRDALGRTAGSHGWGPRAGAPFRPNAAETLSLDWGNPGYRRFAVEWALWYVRTFDIDGFRCDAMHWKEPNLAPDNIRPAWVTIYGGIRILEELRPRLRALKPDAALLSEVWGPIFQPVTDGSYENGWILQALNASWLGTEGAPLMTARQYQRYLAATCAARPAGYLRASFTANHDMQPLGRAARDHPLGEAVSFVHAFSGDIPFVMWLEPEGREAFFTALMRERAALSGLAPDHSAATSDAPDVFLTVWRAPGRAPVLAAASLAREPLEAEVTMAGPWVDPHVRYGSEGAGVVSRRGRSSREPAAGRLRLDRGTRFVGADSSVPTPERLSRTYEPRTRCAGS